MTTSVVAPGYIDLQVNGGFGFEVGEDAGAVQSLARALPRTGVTAWLPTVVSSEPDFYPRAFKAFTQAKAGPADGPGALALGLHLEGPFLAVERKGAHRLSAIESAPDTLLDTWLPNPDVRVVTLAPERPGAAAKIRRLRDRGIVVSLGHTNATYDQFRAGIAVGRPSSPISSARCRPSTTAPRGRRGPRSPTSASASASSWTASTAILRACAWP